MTQARRREHADSLVQHAREFAEAARTLVDQETGSFAPAVDLARHAAELAGKALLLKATGKPPVKSHNIGGAMAAAGVIPSAVLESELSQLLAAHTRARYDYTATMTRAEAESALEIAEALLDAAESFPQGKFHQPRPVG